MRPVGALLLAAGRSTRMGGPNKLLAPLGGAPLVVHAARAVLASRATRPLMVVTGHQADAVQLALSGLEGINFVRNPRFAQGLSTSLATGLDALGDDAQGALILLGDMPLVGACLLDRLIAAFQARADAGAVVPTRAGLWGNPVLLSRTLFPAVTALRGDSGARKLLGERGDVVPVPVENDNPFADADDPAALALLRSRFASSGG